MAKTTRKTETTAGEPKPAARRRTKAAPAEGAVKATTRRRTKAGAVPESVSGSEPTHDEIALRAWTIYVTRGGSHGQAMDDWLQARTELYTERGLKP